MIILFFPCNNIITSTSSALFNFSKICPLRHKTSGLAPSVQSWKQKTQVVDVKSSVLAIRAPVYVPITCSLCVGVNLLPPLWGPGLSGGNRLTQNGGGFGCGGPWPFWRQDQSPRLHIGSSCQELGHLCRENKIRKKSQDLTKSRNFNFVRSNKKYNVHYVSCFCLTIFENSKSIIYVHIKVSFSKTQSLAFSAGFRNFWHKTSFWKLVPNPNFNSFNENLFRSNGGHVLTLLDWGFSICQFM